jgi:hypothetical protein
VSASALCPCCAATWTWLDGPACPHCGWNARDATAGMGAARAVVEENLARAVAPLQKAIEDLRQARCWQDSRKTWLETGDLSALTAMDACDPAGMSGDDWLDCDEYDALRAPVPELPPPRSGRSFSEMMTLVCAILAVLVTLGILLSNGVIWP